MRFYPEPSFSTFWQNQPVCICKGVDVFQHCLRGATIGLKTAPDCQITLLWSMLTVIPCCASGAVVLSKRAHLHCVYWSERMHSPHSLKPISGGGLTLWAVKEIPATTPQMVDSYAGRVNPQVILEPLRNSLLRSACWFSQFKPNQICYILAALCGDLAASPPLRCLVELYFPYGSILYRWLYR